MSKKEVQGLTFDDRAGKYGTPYGANKLISPSVNKYHVFILKWGAVFPFSVCVASQLSVFLHSKSIVSALTRFLCGRTMKKTVTS